MVAIAQTLDGIETFDTKAELFDYVFSQFFEQEWIISRRSEGSFLTILTETFFINEVRITSDIELNGINITNSEIMMNFDFRKAIPKIIVDVKNGDIHSYSDNTLLYVKTEDGDGKIWGGARGEKYMDLKIASEWVEVLSGD